MTTKISIIAAANSPVVWSIFISLFVIGGVKTKEFKYFNMIPP